MEEKYYRIGNRISGLAMAVFGGIIALNAKKNLGLDVAGTLIMIEGVGDLLSGRHHYVSANLLRYFSREKINIRYRGDPRFEEPSN